MFQTLYVEKLPAFASEATHLLHDLRENLALPGVVSLRLINRYDIEGISSEEFQSASDSILSEPQIDTTTTNLVVDNMEAAFAYSYLPGQFDQRADSAAQCIQILTGKEKPTVFSSKVIILTGELSEAAIDSIKSYVINPVDSHEIEVAVTFSRPSLTQPKDIEILEKFLSNSPEKIRKDMSLAMSEADIAFTQEYFSTEENRAPSLTEIRMLDTYWSDHCRHTTFGTAIDDITFAPGTELIEETYDIYRQVRKSLSRDEKPVTLMDIALMGMRELRASGELDNVEVSEEINAASIVVPVKIDDLPDEEWLIQFKNETHNHPTEIEPFGGAATCLGGCIRDPLSGRSYVYQAMRVTGAANPLTPFSETLPGKLPQKKICQVAAKGYSSYGNQIGLATGQVAEVYHPGYVAKRLEIGAVVSASPRSNVFRGSPSPGDVILLIGGRTGRDGVGGATGSSKEHTETALENSAEVQKGDAPTERKIQRLFRNPELTRKIKICNDFGAGGVSVAIGEIAPSLVINLDAVPKKYDGLDGTELAISESQERMAVCVDPSEIAYFMAEADKENLECVHVADVTDSGRLIITWRGKEIVNFSRAFLDTNGVQQTAAVQVTAPDLTQGLEYNHEQRTDLLERSPQETLRESLGLAGERTEALLRRVHKAGEKSGIPVPKTKAERYELHRALRTIEEREIRRCLNDLFIDSADFQKSWMEAGEICGAEQNVFPEEDGLNFIKANNGSYHGHWLQYFERLQLHRILFPDTFYEFIGFLENEDGISFVVRQKTAPSYKDAQGNPVLATPAQIEAHMATLGAFRFRNDDYYLPAEDLFIEDLHDENVLLGTDGATLRFIDPVIYRRPADLPIPSGVADASRGRPWELRLAAAQKEQSLPEHLASLNITSQKGLGEMFDGSVGANTVLWPFGGKHQITPPDAMVAKLPLLKGDTDHATFMSWGFDPYLSEKSPFLGAAYAVTESVCKAVAAGAQLTDIRLTLQEYFPRLGNDPKRWGLPFAALLGAFRAQHELRLGAIGGKDSMSGSFNELDVPPTLVSFALAPGLASLALSPEFKKTGSTVSLVETPILENGLPDFEVLKLIAASLHTLNKAGKIISAHHIGAPGIAAALTKMCLGNQIGFEGAPTLVCVPSAKYFAFLIEHATSDTIPSSTVIGKTTEAETLVFGQQTHQLTGLSQAWQKTLEPVYPTQPESSLGELAIQRPADLKSSTDHTAPATRHSSPKVLIPSFPGTNSEYDSARSFQRVGAETHIEVFRNLTAKHIEESIARLAKQISDSQILFIPGGFSAGDEPDGSAKFIATVLRNPRISDAISDLLENRDGLILGICNGFQALIKTGLATHGKVIETGNDSATLVHNDISRHISQYVTTRVCNNSAPWLSNMEVGTIHTVPVSHGEGKFHAPQEVIDSLFTYGQVATQYCDPDGNPTMRYPYNPNGSLAAIEGITSPCGRVFGKMAHSERFSESVAKNIPGNFPATNFLGWS